MAIKYGASYDVKQQLRLLAKWLSESGYSEAAFLVSAAAESVEDVKRRRSKPHHRASSENKKPDEAFEVAPARRAERDTTKK